MKYVKETTQLARRILMSIFWVVMIVLCALGLESLLVSDRSSLLRDSLTAPVEQLMQQPRTDGEHIIVGVDSNISPVIARRYLKPTFDAIDRAMEKDGKAVLVKSVSREMMLSMLNEGEFDFVVTEPDIYAHLLFEERIQPVSMLLREQAISPAHSSAATIVVRSDNAKLFTLEDIVNEGVRIKGMTRYAFPGFLAGLDAFAKAQLPWQPILNRAIFSQTNLPIEVLREIQSGKIDVGIVPACHLEALVQEKALKLEDFRVINSQPNDKLACLHSTDTFSSLVISHPATTNPGLVIAVGDIIKNIQMKPTATWAPAEAQRTVYEMLYRLRLGPYSHVNYSTINRIFHENRVVFIVAMLLLVAAIFYNVIISFEVTKRTRALRLALTEKEKFAKQQEESNAYIARLERVGIVGQMSSMIAHELKQPLATISNYTSGLLRRIDRGNADEETIVKILKEIDYHNTRAVEIVDHVRQYAKPHEIERESFNLNKIARRSVETFKKTGRSQVPITVEGERKAYAKTDAWELELALINLLKNSAEAFAEVHPARFAEGECQIRVKIEDDGENWLIRVVDNAKLVKKEFTDGFFKRMNTTKEHGLGLGLGIVSSLAERHGGRVWAEPNCPRGVIVTIEIRKAPNDRRKNKEEKNKEEALEQAKKQTEQT